MITSIFDDSGPLMDMSPLLKFTPGPKLARLALVAILSSAPLLAAQAQEQDQAQDPVSMRLDRLEQGLNDVQRQLNAGAVPTNSDNSTPTPPAAGPQALNTEVRLDSLESQMRDLTGQIEEVQHGIQQLNSRLDKLQADDELRFHALEHPGEAAPPVAAPTGSSQTPPDAGAAPPPQTNPTAISPDSGDANAPPSGSGVLAAPGTNQSSPTDLAPSTPPDAQPAPDPSAGGASIQLPSGSPQSQYSYAFGLVRQSDYAGAESAFKQFLSQNPNDPLDGNAQYWLGETYFARDQFQQAAAIFAQGYVKYPKSEKTPNVLLSLGISLGHLHKKAQACLIFTKLEHQFPSMPQGIRDRERSEKVQLACGSAATE